MCRKERDAQIFKSIEQWEIEKVQNLESKDKQLNYINLLEENHRTLERRQEKTPSSLGNKHLKWRISSDL